MIQTRHMKKNNITMDDIQTRDFYIKIYENIKRPFPNSWTTLVASGAKRNINYIFNFYNREIDLGPYFNYYRPDIHNRYITWTICDINNGTGRDDCPVNLITFRYEIKRDKIKQGLRKVCIPCSEGW